MSNGVELGETFQLKSALSLTTIATVPALKIMLESKPSSQAWVLRNIAVSYLCCGLVPFKLLRLPTDKNLSLNLHTDW